MTGPPLSPGAIRSIPLLSAQKRDAIINSGSFLVSVLLEIAAEVENMLLQTSLDLTISN